MLAAVWDVSPAAAPKVAGSRASYGNWGSKTGMGTLEVQGPCEWRQEYPTPLPERNMVPVSDRWGLSPHTARRFRPMPLIDRQRFPCEVGADSEEHHGQHKQEHRERRREDLQGALVIRQAPNEHRRSHDKCNRRT